MHVQGRSAEVSKRQSTFYNGNTGTASRTRCSRPLGVWLQSERQTSPFSLPISQTVGQPCWMGFCSRSLLPCQVNLEFISLVGNKPQHCITAWIGVRTFVCTCTCASPGCPVFAPGFGDSWSELPSVGSHKPSGLSRVYLP